MKLDNTNILDSKFFSEANKQEFKKSKSFSEKVAYLAFKLRKASYFSDLWVKKHLFYFHVSEFKYLKSYLSDIGGVFEILSELANNSLDALVAL